MVFPTLKNIKVGDVVYMRLHECVVAVKIEGYFLKGLASYVIFIRADNGERQALEVIPEFGLNPKNLFYASIEDSILGRGHNIGLERIDVLRKLEEDGWNIRREFGVNYLVYYRFDGFNPVRKLFPLLKHLQMWMDEKGVHYIIDESSMGEVYRTEEACRQANPVKVHTF